MICYIYIERKVYAEEHKMMKGMIQEFISKCSWIILMNGRKRHGGNRKRAGELGLLCIDMPEIYGGGGLDLHLMLY
jgi:alkylation response protein AidB-like acyl-CoA dehydrogenase